MTALVVGASGATGRLLVEQLLNRGLKVKIIVRSTNHLPDEIKNHQNLSIIHASVLDLSDADMALHTQGCDAVASCLGHNLTFKGMYGQPRLLVTDVTRRLCDAIKTHTSEKPVKFVLMNTTGNRNRDLDESISFAQQCVIGFIRLLIPPHSDNEKAADYLRSQIGQSNNNIEWAAVRPDGLVNEDKVSDYEIYPSPIRSAIFDAGTTSRINVAHFMADLITDNDIWQQWQGKMPVIYNKITP
ncbi:MAG: NAD-dependent epimerase [Methylophaga sp.]|nr:MAG: NAD-dependent epimerase [Methylophaga sp.]